MIASSYLINHRELTTFASPPDEFNLQQGSNYLFDLSYLTSFSVIGERAAEFLQGQLSCDVRQVTAHTMRSGAMCNLKGRVLALLDVLHWQSWLLILPSDLIVETQNLLNKVAFLSKVKLEQSDAYQVYGFYLTNPNDILPVNLPLSIGDLSVTSNADVCCYHLGNHFYKILIRKEQAPLLTQPFINKQQMRGSLFWHQLQILQKRVEIYPETRGLFLPHRIDLHLSGHLSFDKGCYKGQEIVARMHYKAKIKHGLQVFTIQTEESLLAGKKLFDSRGQIEVGELIDYSPLNKGQYLIAVSLLLEHPKQVLVEGHQKPITLIEK